jgi:hypothetical protein
MSIGRPGAAKDARSMDGTEVGKSVAQGPALLKSSSQGRDLVVFTSQGCDLGEVIVVIFAFCFGLLVDFFEAAGAAGTEPASVTQQVFQVLSSRCSAVYAVPYRLDVCGKRETGRPVRMLRAKP